MAISDNTATWALNCLRSSQMSHLGKSPARDVISKQGELLLLAKLRLDDKVEVHF